MMHAGYILWSAVPSRVRAGLIALGASQAIVRVAMAFAVESLVRDGARALVLSVATGAVWAGISASKSALRHRVRTGLLRASASSLLHGDVCEVPREGESPHAVLAAVFEGERVIADSFPMVLGNGLAAMALGAAAVVRLPGSLVALLAVAALVSFGLLLVVRRALVHAQEAANRAQRELLARWLEAKDGTLEIAAAALEEMHLARIDDASKAWLQATARVEVGSSLLGRGPMAVLAMALGAITWLRVGHGAEGLALTAFLAASAVPLAALASALGELSRSLGRSEPLVHRLGLPHRVDAAHVVAAPGDVLEGNDLAAAYGAREVLHGLQLRWERGVPLVPEGANGSGKTTLLRALVGLRPLAAGSLRWRGSSGGLAARLPVAFLPQRAHLAPESSVRDALRMLAPHATDDAMHAVLTRVGLADRLASDGLATLVGTLSTGQRQRLAIARVLLVDAEIVVLDEPDANLDQQGRALVDAVVGELARGRFVALVAHGDLKRPAGAAVVKLGS